MAKGATVKDVLYAMQFAGARLVRTPSGSFHLAPDGIRIPARIADEARGSGEIVSIEHRLDGSETFGWRAA